MASYGIMKDKLGLAGTWQRQRWASCLTTPLTSPSMLGIPFWPRLPGGDIYVQAIENFPGVVIDEEHQRIYVDTIDEGELGGQSEQIGRRLILQVIRQVVHELFPIGAFWNSIFHPTGRFAGR
jgi:hypothetical protein